MRSMPCASAAGRSRSLSTKVGTAIGVMALGVCLATSAAAANRLAPDEMVARETSRTPVLDGDLTDEVWQDVARIDGFADPSTGGAPFRETWMKAAYDAANLLSLFKTPSVLGIGTAAPNGPIRLSPVHF